MSVTVTSTPDANHAVFNSVEYAATSDRDGTETYWGVTPVSDAGSPAYCKFNIGGHAYVIDDVLEGTGFAADGLNTDFVVTSVVAGTSFVTNVLWDATYSGAGKLELVNRNIFVRVTVLESAVTKAIKDVKPLSGVYTADIAKILQGLVTYDKVDTAGAILQSPATAGSVIAYTLTVQDFWTDIFGNVYSDTAVAVSTIGGDAIYGFNIALNGAQLFADYLCTISTIKEFLTVTKIINIHINETYQLAFITDEKTVYIDFTRQNIGGGTTIGSLGPYTINNNRGIILIDSTFFPVTSDEITFNINDGAAPGSKAVLSETFTFTRRSNCLNGARVEWKNLLGGFDAYTFPEYEDKQAGKAQSYQNTEWNTSQIKNTQTKKVIGKFSDPDTLDWLSELLTSREVTIDGDNAIILNNSLVTDSRNWKKPILTLRTDDKITN